MIHGFDTVQCAYYLESNGKKGIDFEWLIKEKEGIKKTKSKEPSVVSQKKLYTERHSGLDPESSLFRWIPVFTGMTTLIIIKKF